MSNYSNISGSELLTLYMDNELDPMQQQQLFSELAQSEELQNEMREMLSIRDSIKRDTEAFSVPSAATGAVFAGLGFAVAGAPEAVAQAADAQKPFRMNKIWIPIAAAVLASFFTWMITAGTSDGSSENQISMGNSSKAMQNLENSRFAAADNDVPVMSASSDEQIVMTEKSRQTNNPVSNKRETENALLANNQESDNALLTNNQESKGKEQLSANRDYALVMPASCATRNLKFETTDRMQTVFPVLMSYENETSKITNYDYCIQLRGINAMSFPQLNISDESSELLTNLGLGIYKTLGERWQIGLEIGHEPFSQRFLNSEYGYTIRYEQKPDLFWAGFGAKMNFDAWEKLWSIQPFAQMVIGGTEIGPMGKTIFGLQYFTEGGMGFSLGLEGTMLIYNNQEEWYTSRKLGFTYGMSMNF